VGDFQLKNGQATFTTATLAPGTYSVTATYTSDTSNFLGSSTGTPALQQTVKAAPTSAMVFSSASTSDFGQPVTFTIVVVPSASVATPTGQANLFIDGSLMGTFTLQGGAAVFTTAALPPGDHVVVATYQSDSKNFLDSTDNPVLVQSVTPPFIPNALVPPGSGLSLPFANLVSIFKFKKGKKGIVLILLNNTGKTILGRLVLFGVNPKRLPPGPSFFGSPALPVFLAPHGAVQITLSLPDAVPLLVAGF
jgi:hypothetical protein